MKTPLYRRLLRRLSYAKLIGRGEAVDALQEQLKQTIAPSCIYPDIKAPMFTHCGKWHIYNTGPLLCPLCGTTILAEH